MKGFEDERGSLFFEVIKMLKAKKPKAFLLENVKNLQKHDNGRTFKIMKEELEKCGYYVKYKVLNSCKVGNVPQNRERIYIIGFLDKEKAEKFEFPEEQELTNSLFNVINKKEAKPKAYYYNDGKYANMVKEVCEGENDVYQIRRFYVRVNKNGVCPTLTACMGMGGHNVPIIKDDYGLRKLTPRECISIQGFPKEYKLPSNMADCHIYKQAGNAVSVPVIKKIGENIIKVL